VAFVWLIIGNFQHFCEIMPVPPLYDLAARAMTREQHNEVLPWRRDMYPQTHNALLAMTNHRLRRAGRLVILLLRGITAIPRWLIGIPRAEWHSLHELTPTTSTVDLLSRLYRNVRYTFLPGAGHPFSKPFTLLDLSAPHPVLNTSRVTLKYTFPETNNYFTKDYVIDAFRRIRFHSR
jgi:hypothetical protein